MNNSKYTWINKDMDAWLKKQVIECKKDGIDINIPTVSKIVLDGILKPNEINIYSLIKPKGIRIDKLPKLEVEKKWGKKKLIF